MKRNQHINNVVSISFDGDDTLWDFHSVMCHSLQYTLYELYQAVPGTKTSGLTVDKMIELRDEVSNEHKAKGLTLEDIRYRSFVRIVNYVGIDDIELARHLNRIYLKHRYEDIQLYSDVIPTLDALSSNCILGLLSNGNTYPERIGLKDRFSYVIFAQDVGFEKPDPRIFKKALDKVDCAPHELLHVGDSLDSDVIGANNVGVISVWLNRDKRPNETGIVPDFEISTLATILNLLGVS